MFIGLLDILFILRKSLIVMTFYCAGVHSYRGKIRYSNNHPQLELAQKHGKFQQTRYRKKLIYRVAREINLCLTQKI